MAVDFNEYPFKNYPEDIYDLKGIINKRREIILNHIKEYKLNNSGQTSEEKRESLEQESKLPESHNFPDTSYYG